MDCGDDVCVPPGKICDGTAQCADNSDEEPGICNHLWVGQFIYLFIYLFMYLFIISYSKYNIGAKYKVTRKL